MLLLFCLPAAFVRGGMAIVIFIVFCLSRQAQILKLHAGNNVKDNDISPVAFLDPGQPYRRLVADLISPRICGKMGCLAHEHLRHNATGHAGLIAEGNGFLGVLVMNRGATIKYAKTRIGRKRVRADIGVGNR